MFIQKPIHSLNSSPNIPLALFAIFAPSFIAAIVFLVTTFPDWDYYLVPRVHSKLENQLSQEFHQNLTKYGVTKIFTIREKRFFDLQSTYITIVESEAGRFRFNTPDVFSPKFFHLVNNRYDDFHVRWRHNQNRHFDHIWNDARNFIIIVMDDYISQAERRERNQQSWE